MQALGKAGNLVSNLVGHLVGYLIGCWYIFCNPGRLSCVVTGGLRPDLFHCNRGQGNDGAKLVPLDKLRSPAGVEPCVLAGISHPGPRLVRKPNFPEHPGDGRVLGKGLRRGQGTMPVGDTGILREDAVALNHELGHIAACIVPVCQAVGADLVQDIVSGADSLEAVQHEGIVQVLLAESNHSVVGI